MVQKNINAFLIIFFLFSLETAYTAQELQLLKQKNHFAMIRHARAPGTGDPANFKIGDCKTQRNLSPEGVAQAKALGATLVAALGSDFSVFTSQWCRCKDTAKNLTAKQPIELPVLNSFFQNPNKGSQQTEDLKIWLKENLVKHSPLVLVTHQVNITELTGIFPSEGEIIILEMDKDGKIKRAGP